MSGGRAVRASEMASVVPSLNMAAVKTALGEVRAQIKKGEVSLTSRVEVCSWPTQLLVLRYLRGHYTRKRKEKGKQCVSAGGASISGSKT